MWHNTYQLECISHELSCMTCVSVCSTLDKFTYVYQKLKEWISVKIKLNGTFYVMPIIIYNICQVFDGISDDSFW